MKRKKFCFLSISVFVFMIATEISCNTYVWTPVRKLIEGTWVRSPNPNADNLTEKWTFSEGCLTITEFDSTNSFVRVVLFVSSTTDASLTSCIKYNVENLVHKTYLHADQWFIGSSVLTAANSDIGKWLVVKISKKELYLSTEIANSDGKIIRGDRQKGFVRE